VNNKKTKRKTKNQNSIKIFKTKLFKDLKQPDSRDQAIAAILHVDEIILETLDFEKLTNKIVNLILEELGYLKLGYVMIVLSLLGKRGKILKRVSISKTKEAEKALEATPIPFKKIQFALNEKENYCIKALLNKKSYITNDLSNMLYPAIKRDFVRKMQKKLGVKTSIVLPIVARNKPIGTIIFTLNKQQEKISIFEKQILVGFTNALGIAVEHASLLRRLKQTNERLKRISALKDEFVSLTSHELRTPLTAIGGSLSTILEGYAGKMDKEAEEFLEGAYNENQRLLRLVNNLLNISRIEAGRLKYQITNFNLLKILESVAGTLQGQLKEKGLKLKYNVFEKALVKADQDKVQEVFFNLIGNAVKFTDKGEIKVTAWKQSKTVVVAVEDTGQGIGKKDQKKLFQKFERVVGSNKKGTGLGLYICKTVIEGMQGNIWLKSKKEVGTTFYFTLPYASSRIK